MLLKIFLVGLGGFLGAISRYLVGVLVKNQIKLDFPIATLLVNLFGCLAIGFLFEYFQLHPQLSPQLQSQGQVLPARIFLFLVTGYLGALTTFSSFAWEGLQLLNAGRTYAALFNIGLNVVLGLLAVALGVCLGSK